MTSQGVAIDHRRASSERRRRRGVPLGWEFRIGLVALGVLVAFALYGPLIAPHDFTYMRGLVDGKVPPYAPSAAYPLGSDEFGHDLLSWFLIGARITLGIAAGATLVRLVLGGALGTLAGWRAGALDAILSRLALAFSSIPGTAAAILAMLALDIRSGPLAVALALGLVGWGDSFHHVRRGVRRVVSEPFIGVARSLGMSEWRVVARHVVPNVAPTLVTLAAVQLSTVLITLGEIGLLRLFIGGGISEVDALGRTTVFPSEPDWTSMLAGTRPIFTLYGTPWLVLVPGGALLGAVIGTGLLADALARRAQELDVFALFSRRQTLALLLGAVVIVGPVFLWPSRLATELAYADGFDASRAATLARELTTQAGAYRPVGSDAARGASDWIAQTTAGTRLPIRTTVVVPQSASLSIGDGRIDLGPDLEPLSLASGSAGGPLVLLGAGSLQGSPSDPANAPLHGAIAVLDRPAPQNFDVLAHVAPLFGVVGVIALADDRDAYPTQMRGLDVPVAAIDRARFVALLGRTPSPRGAITALGASASLEMSVVRQVLAQDAIVVEAKASPTSAPLVVVATSYDDPVYVGAPTRSAANVGVLAAVLEQLHRSPLPTDVLVIAVPGGGLRYAGLGNALQQLPSAEQGRIVAVASLDDALARAPELRATPADSATPSTLLSARAIAPRVAGALGIGLRPLGATFDQALSDVGVRTGYEIVTWRTSEREPTSAEYALAGRTLLTLVAYLAHHPDELR